MKNSEKLFSNIASLIARPHELSISGLRTAALLTVITLRQHGHAFDLVCGFDDNGDLLGLMVEDVDDRQIFQSLCFEYGFSIAFSNCLDSRIRVWIGDDLDWIGTDVQGFSMMAA